VIRFFANHPTAANLLMLGLIVIGLMAAPSVKRETFPDIPPDEVQVQVPYPGASADEVENAICQRIEEAVDGIAGVEEMRCESREGLATAIVKMNEGGDFDHLLDDVKTEVEAIDNFPKTIEKPIIKQLGRTDFVVSVAVFGPMSTPDLKAYAEQLKDRLQAVDEVSQVNVKGFSDHQIRIQIPALTLRQYGLSVAQVADVIERQSVDLPAGAIKTQAQDVLVRFLDERRAVREFLDLVVVGGGAGAEIRLGDIATITDRFELDEDKIIFDGQRAALLEVVKTRSEDTLSVVDAVTRFIDQERRQAPPQMVFALTQNISSIVRDRLTMLLRNGGQGLVLVFLTLWLFFSFRYSFWVAAGLPISFLGTIFVMSVIGYSFDMITMVGLLIAIGLLMDDAIVLAENIASHVKQGKSPIEAAIDGARQVTPGVIASFLTTVCVFGSLIFLKGTIGNILKVLPVVLIITLAVSLIEAFLILPHHLGHSLRHDAKKNPSPFRLRFEAFFEWVRERVVGRLVDVSVEWRYLSLGIVVGLLFLSVSVIASGHLKFLAFPEIDGDVIEARILLPQGTPLKRTEAVVARVTAALDRVNAEFTPHQPDNQSLVRHVNVQFNTNKDANETGAHVATISIDLLNAETRNARLDDILNRWREETGDIADVVAVNFVEFQHGPAGRAIDIRLHGPDLNDLKAASTELLAWLGSYRGVLDLTDDLRPGKPEVRLRLSEGAVALGLDASAIAHQLRSAYFGQTAGEIQVGSESYEIDVRLSDLDQNSLADLEYFTVTLNGGKQVPLSAVAVLQSGRGWARINRINGRRTVTILGELNTERANINEIMRHMKSNFLGGFISRHPNITMSLEGQIKEGGETGQSIIRGFMLGLIGVFLLLSFQFRSYIEPIVVLAAIPLGFIGVIWGHVVMGLDLSMPSILGFASLSGVVVNDSILLVHFVKIRRAEGMSTHDAACRASRERFRAVLLTSLTTIAGLLPLLTETSLQAQVLIPLVTSLGFGLMASTLLVLFIVPVLYTILDDFGLSAGPMPAPRPA